MPDRLVYRSCTSRWKRLIHSIHKWCSPTPESEGFVVSIPRNHNFTRRRKLGVTSTFPSQAIPYCKTAINDDLYVQTLMGIIEAQNQQTSASLTTFLSGSHGPVPSLDTTPLASYKCPLLLNTVPKPRCTSAWNPSNGTLSPSMLMYPLVP